MCFVSLLSNTHSTGCLGPPLPFWYCTPGYTNKDRGRKSGDRAGLISGPALSIRLPRQFSFTHPLNPMPKSWGTKSCCTIFVLLFQEAHPLINDNSFSRKCLQRQSEDFPRKSHKGGSRGQLHSFLTSALEGGEGSTSRLAALPTQK